MTIFRSKLSFAVLILGAAAGPFSAAVCQAAAQPSTYTVKPGDTLISIARQLLGDQSRWSELYRLNADRISNPNDIQPGQVIRISGAAPAQDAEPARSDRPAAEPAPQEITRPTPQPIRPAVVVEPEDQDPAPAPDTLFSKRKGLDPRSALRTYREQPYRPLRKGEFFSSGYLTEGQELAFGRLLGSVTPQQIRNLSERATATLYTTVAIEAPGGGKYTVGDSLLLVQLFPGPTGYGDIVVPTGMARVTGDNNDQSLATVVAVYGPIRNGQLTIPAEKFSQAGTTRAQPIENGVTGLVLGQRETRELKHPQTVLFIDKGRQDGVSRGDIFEVRRDPGPRPGAADTVDELMAVLQVVHVRDRTATVRIINVLSPDIPRGSRVVQVAKLPS